MLFRDRFNALCECSLCSILNNGIILTLFMHLQDLPKVPVPELDKTMTEYLRLMEPVLPASHHDRVKGIVKQFTAPTGLGPVLQQYLQEKRDADDNWVRSCKIHIPGAKSVIFVEYYEKKLRVFTFVFHAVCRTSHSGILRRSISMSLTTPTMHPHFALI